MKINFNNMSIYADNYIVDGDGNIILLKHLNKTRVFKML